MPDTQSILDLIKDRLPKHVSLLLSIAFFVSTLLVNVSSSKTHFADIQTEQGKRITALEDEIRNDLATRREVDDVKTTVERIENKLDAISRGK
jgi:hypothetical protein